MRGKSEELAGTGPGVSLPMMLPCWGSRRAVAQGVTFWDMRGFCCDIGSHAELMAPEFVMLFPPPLFGEE